MGLDRWFKEKWVDVKTGKACGRKSANSRKRAYPACRPTVKVSSKTPKTRGELGKGGTRSFARRKRGHKYTQAKP